MSYLYSVYIRLISAPFFLEIVGCDIHLILIERLTLLSLDELQGRPVRALYKCMMHKMHHGQSRGNEKHLK